MRKYVSPIVLLLGMFLLQEKIHAQNNPPPPDCVVVLNNWTTAQSSSSFPNYFTACQTWTFQYTSVGFTGLTITVQSAPAATATTPSTFVTYAGTVSTGINPNTNTSGRITTFSNGLVDIPWIRVNLSGLTGTGTVFGVLYGYKTGYAGSGSGGGTTLACMTLNGVLFGSTGACDANLTWDAATGLLSNKTVTALLNATVTNCADSAGAAACGAAPAGHFVVDAGNTTVVVSTTAVTANSEIVVFPDRSLGALLGITCNTAVPPTVPQVSARTTGVSFTLEVSAPITNPGCFGYEILN